MDRRIVAALAIVAAVAVAALGYAVGVRNAGLNADQRAAVEAIVKDTLAAPGPSTPAPGRGTATAALSDDRRAAIEGIIRNHLIANPEIIRDAINELQRKEDEIARRAQVAAIADNGDLIFSSERQVVVGNPEGDVTLVEFFDYNCAYCKRALDDTRRLVANDPNLRIVLKEFPILGEGSVEAARVGVAVLMTAPDKYMAFHDALLSVNGQVNGARALAVAEDIGLDADALSAELSSPEVEATLTESYQLAGALNLTGTPSYVTKREVIVGAVGYDTLKSKVADVRDCLTVGC